MKLLVIVLCLPVALLVGAILVMIIRDRRHPFYATKEDVRQILCRVLDGTMSFHEWDDFTHIPLKHDQLLEGIRLACLDLDTQGDMIHRDDNKMEEKWIYNEKGLDRVKDLLQKLEKNIEQSPAPASRTCDGSF